MTDRTEKPESYPGQNARRYATAMALLSLDKVVTTFPCLQVPVGDVRTFQAALRHAIIANRADASANAEAVPDLRKHIDHAVMAACGEETLRGFDVWFASTFIHSADDYRGFTTLQDAFVDVKQKPELMSLIALPKELHALFLDRISQGRAEACFKQHYVAASDEELTAWDTEIYVRMEFYTEMGNPYFALYLTASWIDTRDVLDWIVERLTPPEQDAFRQSLMAIRAEKGDNVDYTRDLQSLVVRHA